MSDKAHYQRYMPSWPLPPYAFLPGHSTHPNKPGGHMHEKDEPKAQPINLKDPSNNEILRYSLDLYNLGFYWESHVYLEALWNAHGRRGHCADFFKGFIKLAAAGIKLKLDQQAAGIGHFERGIELFRSIHISNGDHFLGFDLTEVINRAEVEIPRIKTEHAKEMHLPMHPTWG